MNINRMPRIANSFPLKLYLKWFERYASLNKEAMTTYELEVDQTESSYLDAKLELQTLAKEIASMHMQIANDAIRSDHSLIGCSRHPGHRSIAFRLISNRGSPGSLLK